MSSEEETFRAVMLSAGFSLSCIRIMQRSPTYRKLENYNQRKGKISFSDSKTKLNLNSDEMENLKVFCAYYSARSPSQRQDIASEFDSLVFQDYKQTYLDDQRRRSRRIVTYGLLALLTMLLLLATTVLPIALLQWRANGIANALLEDSCFQVMGRRIPVNCRQVQCSCCYQRKRMLSSSDGPQLVYLWEVTDQICSV